LDQEVNGNTSILVNQPEVKEISQQEGNKLEIHQINFDLQDSLIKTIYLYSILINYLFKNWLRVAR